MGAEKQAAPGSRESPASTAAFQTPQNRRGGSGTGRP